MSDVYFSGTQAEDALNIVLSNFNLKNIHIKDTRSDAFDADFSKGQITGGSFENIGGDGIDFSGSEIEVSGTKFDRVRDKAVSVGEKSQLSAKHITVRNSGVAVASKDGSLTTVSHSTFSQIKNAALMSYVKKPEYGPAKIKVEKVEIKETPKRWVAQVENHITVDGKVVETESLDTKKAYRTYMKK